VIVDLLFSVIGESVPTDHAYALYAALSRSVPAFHQVDTRVRFAPLTGMAGEPGHLRLTDRSHLRVRLPADAIRTVLSLAGRSLDVAGANIRLGPPSVVPLVPAPSVVAYLVTFKHGEEVDHFLVTAKAKLKELGVTGDPTVPVISTNAKSKRAGETRRRIVRIKDAAIVGYSLVVSGLSADDSIRLQEHGLGGRTRMGCGFFLPTEDTK